MTDRYEAMGEFHDIFMSGPWEALAPALGQAFGSLSPADVVLDIGAGTGVGTVRLARRTRAQIVAVEPSLTMRAALLARIGDDEDLAARVSVFDGTVPEILDEVGEITGFVCAHMLGHLSEDARRATFRQLAEMLAAHGRGLITLPREMPAQADAPDRQTSVNEERWLGRHRYTASHQIPDGDSTNAVTVYRVYEGDRVVRSLSAAASWLMPSMEQLTRELHDAGLTVAERIGSVGIVRPITSILTLEDVRRALPLVARDQVLTTATQFRSGADRSRARAATCPARRALAALACADELQASAPRAGAADTRILELACGPAVTSRLLLAAGAAQVDAVDADSMMIDAARTLGAVGGLALHVADATGVLPFRDASFDMVWMGDFWDSAAVSEIRRVLRPGGRLVTRGTVTLEWMPQDDTAFVARVAGAGCGMARLGVASPPRPEEDLAGWEMVDTWRATAEFTAPMPEVVDELLLQDFAWFLGDFAAPDLSEPDWVRLCALVDPGSPDRALSRADARFAWTFDYHVYR